MTDVQSATTSRGKFLRNAAKGGIVLAGAGGVLAPVQGGALASGPTSSDITTLQAAYRPEALPGLGAASWPPVPRGHPGGGRPVLVPADSGRVAWVWRLTSAR